MKTKTCPLCGEELESDETHRSCPNLKCAAGSEKRWYRHYWWAKLASQIKALTDKKPDKMSERKPEDCAFCLHGDCTYTRASCVGPCAEMKKTRPESKTSSVLKKGKKK